MRRIVVVALIWIVASVASAAASFKVIVHPDLNVASLSAPTLSDVFMKKLKRWSNGTLIIPVDLNKGPVREQFSQAVHGKSTAAVKMYWTQEIFAGRGVPPMEKRSDEEVIAYVKTNKGAIGYVSDQAPSDGVRVVPISPAP